MPRAVIVGGGMCLPPGRPTNDQIASFLPTPETEHWTPPWVQEKLGIVTRASAFDFQKGEMFQGHDDLDNAFNAAQQALDEAGLKPADIDRVIWATTTPVTLVPDPACLLHERLGMRRTASAIGLTAVGCGGFIYALDMGDSDIRSGKCQRVLVIGSLVVAPYINAIHRSSRAEERERHLRMNYANFFIFGEGAGAVILEASADTNRGILHSFVGASGANNPVIFEGGGSRNPATHETVANGLHRFAMDTKLVAIHGPRLFKEAVIGGLANTDYRIEDFKYFLFHQVNPRQLNGIANDLGVPIEKVEMHAAKYGNLDTATLPVAYTEARRAGRIKPGDLVLCAAIGAGWQFGAAIVRV